MYRPAGSLQDLVAPGRARREERVVAALRAPEDLQHAGLDRVADAPEGQIVGVVAEGVLDLRRPAWKSAFAAASIRSRAMHFDGASLTRVEERRRELVWSSFEPNRPEAPQGAHPRRAPRLARGGGQLGRPRPPPSPSRPSPTSRSAIGAACKKKFWRHEYNCPRSASEQMRGSS